MYLLEAPDKALNHISKPLEWSGVMGPKSRFRFTSSPSRQKEPWTGSRPHHSTQARRCHLDDDSREGGHEPTWERFMKAVSRLH